jgi:predicted permease
MASLDVALSPVRHGLFQFYRSYAWLIVAGVALVLMVACVNLAALLLARGRGREHAVAIRVALGASSGRILRLVMIEAAVLCGLSAAIALVAAQAVFQVVLALVPAGLRGVASEPLDARLIGIALVVAIAAGAIAAVWPALRAQRIDVLAGLRQDGRSASGRLRGGSTLMALEAALGVLLVVGAATTVASFGGMVFRYPGFDQQNLYDVRVNHGYDRTQGMRYLPVRVRRVLDTLRSTPGIESAGAVSLLTLGMQRRTGDAFWRDLGREGHRFGVSDGYFETIGTPLVAGRPFEPSDLDQAARVAVVSRSAVWRLWPGRSPSEVVGNQVDHLGAPLTVVGVVDDITSAPGEAPTPGLYLPMTLDDAPVGQSAVEVAIRVPSGTSPDLEAIRARLGQTMGPGSVSVESIADRTAPFLQRPRFQAVLFSTLAVIALVLASIGLYAVAAFDVARREHEMGIRLSLGATARDLRRAVIGSAVRPVAIGAAGGLVATWWAAQYLQSFLYEVDARSPWTYALVALVLVATAVIAAWLPARRAAKTDPAIVLRAV